MRAIHKQFGFYVLIRFNVKRTTEMIEKKSTQDSHGFFLNL